MSIGIIIIIINFVNSLVYPLFLLNLPSNPLLSCLASPFFSSLHFFPKTTKQCAFFILTARTWSYKAGFIIKKPSRVCSLTDDNPAKFIFPFTVNRGSKTKFLLNDIRHKVKIQFRLHRNPMQSFAIWLIRCCY